MKSTEHTHIQFQCLRFPIYVEYYYLSDFLSLDCVCCRHLYFSVLDTFFQSFIFFFSFSNSLFLFLSFAFACYYRSIMCVDEIVLFAFSYENISIPRAFHTIDMLYSFFLRLLSFQCVSDDKQNIKTKRLDFFYRFFLLLLQTFNLSKQNEIEEKKIKISKKFVFKWYKKSSNR